MRLSLLPNTNRSAVPTVPQGLLDTSCDIILSFCCLLSMDLQVSHMATYILIWSIMPSQYTHSLALCRYPSTPRCDGGDGLVISGLRVSGMTARSPLKTIPSWWLDSSVRSKAWFHSVHATCPRAIFGSFFCLSLWQTLCHVLCLMKSVNVALLWQSVLQLPLVYSLEDRLSWGCQLVTYLFKAYKWCPRYIFYVQHNALQPFRWSKQVMLYYGF